MADIRPFRGTHYSKDLLADWAKVICPVYDIIPPGQHERLYNMSPYNFVRLEAGRDLPQDSTLENKYTRAATTFNEWLAKGALITDSQPAFYVHDHYFAFGGREYTRRGIIARVHLEEWDRRIIRPHESTFAEARSDRLSLLWSINANTSSVLGLYQDLSGTMTQLLAREALATPEIDLKVSDAEGHRVWAVAEPNATGAISAALRGTPIYIADGHHRYESALTFSKQKRTATQSAREMPWDFVMMTLVEFQDPGLLILPPHRLVRGITKSAFDGLYDKLSTLFRISEFVASKPRVWEEIEGLRGSSETPFLALLGLKQDAVFVLEPRNLDALGSMMPQFHSDLYRKLEVSIIDHVLLENMLGVSHEKEKVGYSYLLEDAIARVQNGEYQIAFLVKPITAGTIKAVADRDDKMPKKSTYFYPKVPAGLIINRFI